MGKITEKKFLDCRIEWEGLGQRITEKEIEWALSRFHRNIVAVTPLPELASAEEIEKILKRYGISEQLGLQYKLAHALFGKVALPSPEPEKECEHVWIFCGTGGGQTSINNDYLCQKCGRVKKEVLPIKPPEKKELPELPEQLKGDWLTDSQAINKICQKIDALISWGKGIEQRVKEMEEEK